MESTLEGYANSFRPFGELWKLVECLWRKRCVKTDSGRSNMPKLHILFCVPVLELGIKIQYKREKSQILDFEELSLSTGIDLSCTDTDLLSTEIQ